MRLRANFLCFIIEENMYTYGAVLYIMIKTFKTIVDAVLLAVKHFSVSTKYL